MRGDSQVQQCSICGVAILITDTHTWWLCMVKAIKKNLRDTDQVILKEELKAMKKVLRRLGFVNREGVVEMKGRVACEINSADELVLTEMIFNGVFNDLAPEQIVALASCFVFQEKVRRTAHTIERAETHSGMFLWGYSARLPTS